MSLPKLEFERIEAVRDHAQPIVALAFLERLDRQSDVAGVILHQRELTPRATIVVAT